MSTKRTLFEVDSGVRIYEETLETPVLKEGHWVLYPVYIEIIGHDGQETLIRLTNKQSEDLVRKFAEF